jgi:hypothetical protein
MTRTGHVDARNYGDSPVTRVYVPIASPVFVSCSLMLAAQKVACTINLRHSFEAPLRVDCGVLATPSQARARDLAPTLCRALMVQAASRYFSGFSRCVRSRFTNGAAASGDVRVGRSSGGRRELHPPARSIGLSADTSCARSTGMTSAYSSLPQASIRALTEHSSTARYLENVISVSPRHSQEETLQAPHRRLLSH